MDFDLSRALVFGLPRLLLVFLYVLTAHAYLLLRRVPVCKSLLLRESVAGFAVKTICFLRFSLPSSHH